MAAVTDGPSEKAKPIDIRGGTATWIKRRWAVLVIGGYCLLYVVLSLAGEYSQRLYPSGRLVYASSSSGLVIPDSVIWMPWLIEWTPYSRNGLGWGYAPLVLLDRAIWHRNVLMVRFRTS